MLGWLLRRLGLRSGRAVFRFWDGSRYRVVCPVRVHRELRTRMGERWPVLVDLIHKATLDPAKHSPTIVAQARQRGEEAFLAIRDSVRVVFEVKPLEQGGLNEPECLDLLANFVVYLGRLTEAARPFFPPVSSGEPSVESLAPTSAPGSPSSSTSGIIGSNSPAPSPTGSPSPSPAGTSEG